MKEIIFKHTAKIFILDAILFPIAGLGFFMAIYHLLKILSESLVIDEKNVRLKFGILSTHEVDVPFNKINSISVRQGIWGKTINYGSIVIFTGNDLSGIVFKHLSNPSSVKSLIQSRIQ